MLPQWLEQFDTLQQYLRSLFDTDSLPVDRLASSSEPVLEEAVRLLTSYGRKMMELSESATYQHRNKHYLPRKQVESDLLTACRGILGEDARLSYEQIVAALSSKQEERNSIWNRLSMPESRLVVAESALREGREQERNSRASKGKSQTKRNGGAVRQALQVKGFLQAEEEAIRDFFSKLNRMLQAHKVPVGSLQQEALKFTRVIDENNSDRISELVRTSTETHTRNINNLCSLVELLHDSLQGRLVKEGQAEGRLTVFMEEAKRMEEVYSYTLSKMLQRLSQAKQALPPDTLAIRHLESLEEITRKLYGLYPSQESMQSLAIRAREGKSYGLQVSLGKPQTGRPGGSDAFRLQARLGECLDRFQRNNKHRKTLQLKEVDKLIETIREVMPARQPTNESQINYQEEIKSLLDVQERREKEAVDALSKKLKKAEKRVQELQVAISQLKQQQAAAKAEWQQQKKRLGKRADSQQSELKKLAKEKAALDASLSEYIQDIQRMRQEVRRQGEEEGRLRKALERQCAQLRQECETVKLRLKTAVEQAKSDREQMAQERTLYRQKIGLTEGQLQQQRQLAAGLRVQLQAALGQHRQSRAQLSQMSRVYQQKIRELDGVIQHLKELQQGKLAMQSSIQQLQTSLRHQENLFRSTQATLLDEQERNRLLQQEKAQLQTEVEHWKTEGGLTDSDLKQLRDQVEKVSRAYLQSEQQVEVLRKQLGVVMEEREKLLRERLRLTRLVEDLQAQVNALKVKQQAAELADRDLRDEYYQAAQQAKRLQREVEELRRDAGRIRKELQEEREERTKSERELRQIRQEQQARREGENVEQGRRRMELESLRMELRRKNEQSQKQQAAYQQKLSLAHQKIKQLQELSGQKMLLSRLMHNHQTQ